jgi:hypothetical protein
MQGVSITPVAAFGFGFSATMGVAAGGLTHSIYSELQNKNGCAPAIESLAEKFTHCFDRDLPTTQTASLIAASFRT